MANDWAEAAWVVKTLQKKFKINENAGIYIERLNQVQQNIDDILLQKLAIADTATQYTDEQGNVHIQPTESIDNYTGYLPDTIWFILSEQEESNNG